ncbi:hypothetical protein COO60DRAFT_1461068 [Scenedesmus sp. NREL 46B-D3]|nr:hypothetical protein COO60DRAFT_1461068 [Scenedesmus sp. NREL 46B-D3]
MLADQVQSTSSSRVLSAAGATSCQKELPQQITHSWTDTSDTEGDTLDQCLKLANGVCKSAPSQEEKQQIWLQQACALHLDGTAGLPSARWHANLRVDALRAARAQHTPALHRCSESSASPHSATPKRLPRRKALTVCCRCLPQLRYASSGAQRPAAVTHSKHNLQAPRPLTSCHAQPHRPSAVVLGTEQKNSIHPGLCGLRRCLPSSLRVACSPPQNKQRTTRQSFAAAQMAPVVGAPPNGGDAASLLLVALLALPLPAVLMLPAKPHSRSAEASLNGGVRASRLLVHPMLAKLSLQAVALAVPQVLMVGRKNSAEQRFTV